MGKMPAGKKEGRRMNASYMAQCEAIVIAKQIRGGFILGKVEFEGKGRMHAHAHMIEHEGVVAGFERHEIPVRDPKALCVPWVAVEMTCRDDSRADVDG